MSNNSYIAKDIMEQHIFIDRFFQSQYELLDTRHKEKRDINSLYTFLNNLHTVGDRLKEEFDCEIKSYPEFKILRIIRNYLHHAGDFKEIRVNVVLQPGVISSHNEHLIIPLEVFAKSLKSFIDKNTLPEGHKKFKNKQQFISRELDSISEIFSYTQDLLSNLDVMCNKPRLKLDGEVFELGFDMYKFVYNIANIVADKCRLIEELKNKAIIRDLEQTYTQDFNIDKRDVLCSPEKVPVLTTSGFVYPAKIEAAR